MRPRTIGTGGGGGHESPIEAAAADGRDFLYTAFQFGEPERLCPLPPRPFGTRILRYAENAWRTDGGDGAIAACDLAIHDPEVVAAHHANGLVVAGRYGTLFRSAVTVAAPIPAAAIVSIEEPAPGPAPRPDVTLEDIGRRR